MSDLRVQAYVKTGEGPWKYIGATEMVKDTQFPYFMEQVKVEFNFQAMQRLML